MGNRIASHARRYFPKKLSFQLICLFMATFVLVLSASYLFLYAGIEKILKRNYETGSIQQFRQCDYNITSFCDTVDIISRQLVMDANLQGLVSYGDMPESDQKYQLNVAIRQFNNILNNYRYIRSVMYYSSEGLTVKCSSEANLVSFDEQSRQDWFYQSAPYRDSKAKKQKLVWFGGYTSGDFGFTPGFAGNEANTSGYYVSASRNVLAGSATGTLVLNISMEHFTSVYNNQNSSSETGKIYIVDEKGTVISSNVPDMVGKISSTLQHLTPGNNIENFNIRTSRGEEQAVYYRLKTPVGILVSEIPVSIITRDTTMLRTIILIMFGVGLAIAFILFGFWLLRLMRPLNRLVGVIQSMEQGNLGLMASNPPDNEFGMLMNQFNRMSASIQQLFRQKEEAEAEKRNLEMETLRAQINPHFIYNTLNIIKWMAVIDRKKNIADCVTTFSEFLEIVLRKHDGQCTLEEELRYLDNYIKIMNYRFTGGLEMDIRIPEDYLTCRIIRFILQPVVENSIVHGLSQKINGKIRVSLEADGADIVISVADNGTGMSEERLVQVNDILAHCSEKREETGIGLTNVCRRLKLHYGEQYGMELKHAVDGGTEVCLKMPLVR